MRHAMSGQIWLCTLLFCVTARGCWGGPAPAAAGCGALLRGPGRRHCVCTDTGAICRGLPARPELRPTHRLIYLTLSDNGLGTLPRLDHARLSRLSASNNSLRALRPAALSGSPALRHLNLSSNRLTELQTGTFDHNVALEELDLRHNLIRTFNESLFHGLTALRHINMGFNKLSSIPAHTFAQNLDLRVLILDHNPLQHVAGTALPPGGRLRLLDLTHTAQNHVPTAALRRLALLQRLVFRSHQLFLTPDMLTAVPVQHIHFDGCNLQLLPVAAFRCLAGPGLRTLSLGRNRLVCDCRMLEFRAWVQRSGVRLAHAHCAATGSLASFTVQNFPSAGCPPPDPAPPACHYPQVTQVKVTPEPTTADVTALQAAAHSAPGGSVNHGLVAVLVLLLLVLAGLLLLWAARRARPERMRDLTQRARGLTQRMRTAAQRAGLEACLRRVKDITCGGETTADKGLQGEDESFHGNSINSREEGQALTGEGTGGSDGRVCAVDAEPTAPPRRNRQRRPDQAVS